MLVYANKDGAEVWGSHQETKKQGRVPEGTMFRVISDSRDHFELEPGSAQLIVEAEDPTRSRDIANYPNFWIRRADVTTTPPDDVPAPILVGGELSDVDLVAAIAVIIKYLKQ